MPIAAYNPKLYLIESHVASYKIYIIKNPLTNEVFYVGQTMQDLKTRLSGHISEEGGVNKEKSNYIKEIIAQGQSPIIQEVETIHTTCYIDKASVHERENYWIKYYKGIGCKLLNLATPQGHEYQHYLSSIKRGETSWHYYYCGRTVGGIEIYDERRIVADGFDFSRVVGSRKWTQTTEDVYAYSPWKNKRYLEKYKIESESDHLYYDKTIYRDTNPEYYADDY